jgi:hypothetical protein
LGATLASVYAVEFAEHVIFGVLAMATKSDFTADEWSMLLASPMIVGMAVTIADPSGIIGMLHEGWAGARSMLNPKDDPNASELAKAVAEDLVTSDGRSAAQNLVKARITGKSATELKPQIIAVLEDIGSLVDRKAGNEAAPFKSWLKETAQKVAEASTEGGFLGFGGVAVSDAEKASLDEVSRALRA